MKISERWLREMVNPAVSRDELIKQLTMAGLEIEGVEVLNAGIDHIVVGEVLTAEQHPNADKLRVATVNVGKETLQIVCGAANCRPGIKIPAALVGAKLPGGMEIKNAKLRGVDSSGMLCSAKELGLAEESSGLLELPLDAPVGTPIVDYLQLDDAVLEVNLTPNRGDCLGARGIAREVAVLNQLPFNPPAMAEVPATITDKPSIELLAPEACPRYCGRIIKGLNTKAATPLWMQEKLRRSGVRSISLAVDVTNYVMLELGHPMHAFDLKEIKGGIRVRMAVAGEKLTLLDGREVELTPDTLLIADHERPIALGGIMGGEHSGIADGSSDVLLESAYFNPIAIAGRARKYGLHTDASHRYERGVDPTLQRVAIERATQLLLELGGGQAGPVVDAKSDAYLPKPATIHLRRARIARLLGFTLPDAQVEGILTRLGLQLSNVADGWHCVAPLHRFDISIEADLIEELVRVHGYDKLEARVPHADSKMVRMPEHRVLENRLRDLLADRGYQEVVTYTFVEPKLMKTLEPRLEPLALLNPITPELAVMRTNLWAGLVNAARYNLNRQISRLALFEMGLRFVPQAGGELNQEKVIAGLVTGAREPLQWNHGSGSGKQDSFDFYDLKGDIEALLAMGGERKVEFRVGSHPALHPGQTAEVVVDGKAIGLLGALHPEKVKELDLPTDVFVFELALVSLSEGVVPRYRELSRFPGVGRDLALVVDESLPVEALLQVVRDQAGESLEELRVFDIYRGKGIDLGRKSVAVGLIFRHPSRTLTDSDVATLMDAILAGLKAQCGAQLRE
ncbi:phenylalanine--tRNA ligase subunit beta [Permianibacter sp. IMCC34836]|uniref:phenylalanine--tRNA ligase subunit beta n=1 Tax=Permianibacter fluminis TaxID=2738515 RepID=UPI00155323BF|nr:phenylalanine--tRNA ligase subunit beta [Permianibacter fluminis]NQD37231.1 phenylalanine--tRNA ligase subunit beta [Permianibacter fluminis]